MMQVAQADGPATPTTRQVLDLTSGPAIFTRCSLILFEPRIRAVSASGPPRVHNTALSGEQATKSGCSSASTHCWTALRLSSFRSLRNHASTNPEEEDAYANQDAQEP